MKLKLTISLFLIIFTLGCSKENQTPVCNISSPENGAEYIIGTKIPFSVEASDRNGIIISVSFYIDETLFTSDSAFPYSCYWDSRDSEPGNHVLRTVVIDDDNAEAESSINFVIVAYKPDVITGIIQRIRHNTAICSAKVKSSGGMHVVSKGVCWNTTGSPTIDDNIIEEGSGIGEFTSSLSGLNSNTTYFVRAFAVNNMGTSYGEEKQFTTKEGTGFEDGTFTDDRDHNSYDYKTFGTQTWMIENLYFLPDVSPSGEGSEDDPHHYVYAYDGNIISEAKATDHYEKFGTLYNWEAAMTACPQGWHLPSKEEWEILKTYLINDGFGYGGSGSDIGKAMASSHGWNYSSVEGTVGNDTTRNNSTGFNAVPGGAVGITGFGALGYHSYFWLSTLGTPGKEGIGACHFYLKNEGDESYQSHGDRKTGLSVRCVKD